ncbi:hypothetical protein D0Z07_3961 [Hyphodiscus hymeniophilus]|uniref:Heterokaryon incompatibility domain-containing protein n=1 Tax=Hyphodiscus hymeniophilus TaxID=353542 RepID=A0A9P6VL11_9HELO|nr:hypothetical protein D0Z07_3961 [Hyphodiscus hymeniophilus]
MNSWLRQVSALSNPKYLWSGLILESAGPALKETGKRKSLFPHQDLSRFHDASSQIFVFDFVPIFATSPEGDKPSVLEGLWFRSGGSFGHLVFSAPLGDPASFEIKRRPPVKGYDCREAYDLVRRWLEECSAHHPLCSKHDYVPLPTRIIDIGDANKCPTLYSPPPGTRGRYLALSYCWGKSQPVTLTETRLKRAPVSFPLRTLPQTLRDAIIIASHLGFQYIWIDALCIVQDSNDGWEWKQESAKMNHIYGNSWTIEILTSSNSDFKILNSATLTIAAAAASSTTEGIFSFGTGQPQPSCSLPWQLSNGEIGSVNVEVHETEEKKDEPLDSRAWALQEALISPRLLRYGNSQMSWKCNQIEQNANGPLISRTKQPTSKCQSWTSIVTDYTARTLTYNSDRLAALEGYAKLLGIKRPYDEYLSGLWKSELLEQLLWYRSAASQPNPRPLSSCAPSWSWASIDSPVRFTYWPQDYQSHCEVIYSPLGSPFPESSNSTLGRHQSALRVHGYVKRLIYDDFFQDRNGTPTFESKYKFQSAKRRGSGVGEVIYDISDPFGSFEDGNRLSLICLHITPTCGLVLVANKEQDTNDLDLYERIGLATGSVFEEWFTDTSCGSYRDELVRIV